MDATKEKLEQVIQVFATKICTRQGIHFVNGGYSIEIEEDMGSDFVMFAGNPVVIKIHYRVFAEGLLAKNMIPLKHTLQRALEIASKRMLHTLSQNPTAPVLSKDMGEKSWTKRQSADKLLPKLLPLERITFSTKLIVVAADKVTGEHWMESGYAHKIHASELERRAHHNLSKLLLGDDSSHDETPNKDETQETSGDSVQLHPPEPQIVVPIPPSDTDEK
jgi:hypothetical protein